MGRVVATSKDPCEVSTILGPQQVLGKDQVWLRSLLALAHRPYHTEGHRHCAWLCVTLLSIVMTFGLHSHVFRILTGPTISLGRCLPPLMPHRCSGPRQAPGSTPPQIRAHGHTVTPDTMCSGEHVASICTWALPSWCSSSAPTSCLQGSKMGGGFCL